MPAPTITPGGSINKEGLSVTVFNSNQTITLWSATGGTLSSITATSATWKAPNVSGTYTLSAKNAANETTVITITVVGVFQPEWWAFLNQVTKDKKVRVFIPLSGAPQSRTDQGAKEAWDIKRSDADSDVYLALEAFWNAHYPPSADRLFYLDDVLLERRITCYANSGLTREPSETGVGWSMRIQEV
jgi:hypothetical protein